MLDNQYREKGLEILAFPCSQFFGREFSNSEEIIKYIENRGIKFRVFEKSEVNGDHSCEIYKYLRKMSKLNSKHLQVNFAKFLLNREGQVVSYHGVLTHPLELINEIEALL